MDLVLAEFAAPWSRAVRLATAASIALLGLLVLTGLILGPHRMLIWRLAMIGVPLILLFATLPFMVRGYALTATQLQVRRLGWCTVLPLAGLASATGEPQGMRGSLRLFGIGGLFGISGWFWSRRFGRFRAYATDPERVVLLRYQDGSKVVVTPHDVQQFIVRIRTLANLASPRRDLEA